jgi:hypothetical protein
MTERPEYAESREAAPRKQPTDATDTADPTDPMERIDPTDPMERIDPFELMERIDPFELMERIESVEFTDQRALPAECLAFDMALSCPPRSGLTRGAAIGYERRIRQH